MLRHVAIVFVISFSSVSILGTCGAADIADFSKQPIGKVPAFKKPNVKALLEASPRIPSATSTSSQRPA